ncbi:MAG: SMI1/KNR4 family protein [Sphingomicrobium sp.]
MGDRLSDALVARIKARLGDEWRLTGEGDYLRTPKDRRRKSDSASPMLEALLEATVLRDAASFAAPVKLVGAVDEKAVAKVEKALGFAIPPALRQLSLQVGDGNFGPFNGIRRLANWAKDYAKLRAELPAERGREWPAKLLPIVYLNGKRICLDRATGAVVLWTKPPKKASEKKWLASFVPQSASLEEWLERWVDTPTFAEGGPDGGWTPPDSELERRAGVEQEKDARRAAEAERAASFTLGDIAPLDPALIERVRSRAIDPDQRTPMARADRQPGGLLSALVAPIGLKVVATGLGPGSMMMRRGTSGKLGQPATEPVLAAAEQQLGFALPAPLRQLYAIADGGFGPTDAGLWPLATVVRDYRAKVGSPQGPLGEPWPAKLLPLCDADPALSCLDLETGKVVEHDVQRMDHEGPGQWRRSFAPEADSLADWLEAWLGAPDALSQIEQEQRKARARMARDTIRTFEAMSDDERAGHGLDGPDWRDEVRRRIGLPPRDY